MSEKVTIGDEIYVRTATNGWVNEKTKIPANKGLQSLLELIENGQLSGEDMPPKPHLPEKTTETTEAPKRKEQEELKTEEKVLEVTEADGTANKEEFDVVTIAGSTYIYDDEKGWIDKKSKRQVPPELLSLIENVTNKKNAPTIKVERNYDIEPVTIAGTKYIFDTKKRYWILEKGKQKAPDEVQKLLSRFVSQGALDKLDEESLPSKIFTPKRAMENAEGVQAKKEKKPKAVVTHSIIIEMVEKLASINQTIIDDLERKYATDTKKIAQDRENTVEGGVGKDGVRVLSSKDQKPDSMVKTAMFLGVVGLVATHLDEITEVITDIAGWLGKANTFFSDLSDIASGDFSSLGTIREMTPEEQAEQDRLFTWDGFSERAGEMWDDITSGDIFTIRREDEEGDATPEPRPSAPEPEATPTSRPTPTVSARAAPTNPGSPRSGGQSRTDRTEDRTNVGGIPRGDIRGLARWLQGQGLSASLDLGRADRGSAHASGDAIDINAPGGIVEANSAEWGRKFDQLADQLTAAGYNVLWRVRGHYNHIHVQTGTRGVRPGSFWRGGGNVGRDNLSSTGGGSEGTAAPLRETEDGSFRALINLLTLSGGDRTASYAGSMTEITEKNNNNIADLAVKKYADMVDRTVEEEDDSVPLQLPNLNARRGGTIETPSSSSDRNVVNDYLVYFGYEAISRPMQSS